MQIKCKCRTEYDDYYFILYKTCTVHIFVLISTLNFGTFKYCVRQARYKGYFWKELNTLTRYKCKKIVARIRRASLTNLQYFQIWCIFRTNFVLSYIYFIVFAPNIDYIMVIQIKVKKRILHNALYVVYNRVSFFSIRFQSCILIE